MKKNIFINTYHVCFYGIIVSLLTTACTRNPLKPLKDRERNQEHIFVDGTAEDIYNIKNFQAINLSNLSKKALNSDKILKIKTYRIGEKAKISISQTGTFIDPDSNISFVNQYYVLSYNTTEKKTDLQKLSARLLGKLKTFKGFPNTPYYIVPQLEGNYLILYRVAQENNIPYDELPIAIKSNTWVATPLVGYPIEYCVAKVSLNNNNEKTGKHVPQCIGIAQSSAQYIRLREDRKQVFKYNSKIDIFPQDFFNGQWFYTRTIIKSPERDINAIGHQPFESAHLVEFKKASKRFNVVDASGYQMKEEDRVATLFIPVDWKEYELNRDSDIMTHFSERENTHTVDITRPYFKIKFEELIRTEQKSGVKEVKNVFITNDYFSFKIATHVQNRGTWIIKYSFKKKTENLGYIEKQWFEKDSSLFFPTFETVRRYYKDVFAHTKKDNEYFFRTTRFDPKSKVIKWYFSTQTPKEKWVRDIGRIAINYVNTIFQKAGEGSDNKITIELGTNEEDKELGDIRYNIINMIVTESTTNNSLLGLGPNISNPITGEIVSATANVWVTNITDIYTVLLRRYIRFHVYPPAWKILPSSPGTSDFLHEKIQNICPEVKTFITEQTKKQSSFDPKLPDLEDEKVLQECSVKIAKVKILETTLHEILHGFGFRHVFSASTDKNNYYNSYDEITEIFGEQVPIDITDSHPHPPKYSSVMDYADAIFPILPVPGKYDIAATRFLYFDKIELTDESMIEISAGADRNFEKIQKNILESTKEQGILPHQLKKYKVCGGRKDADIDIDDPLCERFDYGSTPSEIVQNLIRENKDLLMSTRNRHDSEFAKHAGLNGIIKLTKLHLKNIQEKWIWYLFNLLYSHSKNVLDFSALSDEDISSYLQILKHEYTFGVNKEFKQYYEARKILYDYYKEMFFLPPKHCIYQQSDGSYQAMAMEIILTEIQREYFESPDAIFTDCQSPAIQKWAEENKMGSFITEVGYFINNTIYSFKHKFGDYFDELSPFVQPQPVWDVTVTALIKVLNEPDFRRDFYNQVLRYYLQGLDLNPYINNLPEGKDITLPRFLSYRIDTTVRNGTKNNKEKNLDGTFFKRLDIFNETINTVSNNTSNPDVAKRIALFTGSQVINTSQNLNVDLIHRIPFLQEKYDEYIDFQSTTTIENTSFLRFLESFPAVYVKPYTSIMIVPYSKNNMAATKHITYNNYKACIEQHGINDFYCKNIEEKRTYIQIVDSASL